MAPRPSGRMESRWALPCSRPPPKDPARLPGPPPGGTAAPCACGSTGRRLRSHTCRGLPTRPRVSRLDTVMTWSNERAGSHGRQGGDQDLGGRQLDETPAPQGRKPGWAATTTTLSARGTAPADPPVSELKGPWGRPGLTSACQETRLLQAAQSSATLAAPCTWASLHPCERHGGSLCWDPLPIPVPLRLTCICVSGGSAAGPCCCGSRGRRSPGGTAAGASCMAPSCSSPAHKRSLRRGQRQG